VSDDKCQCELSGFCTARNIALKPTLQVICRENKPRIDAMLAGEKPPQKERHDLPADGDIPRHIRERHYKAKERVGDSLTSRIEGLLGIKSGKGCNCKDLAEKMNGWGIAGCESPKNRKEIIETLLKNRDILKVSLAKSAFAFGREEGVAESLKMAGKLAGDWWHGKDVSEEAFLKGANWLLDRAIEDTREKVMESNRLAAESGAASGSVSGPVSPRPSRRQRIPRKVAQARRQGQFVPVNEVSPAPKASPSPAEREKLKAERLARRNRAAADRPSGGIGSCFRRGSGPARFIKSAELQEDIKLLLAKVPSDITAIAGVARSGLSVATMLAMYLQLPMITIRQTMNDIVDTGNGWRLGGSRHIDPRKGKILVVDDTVMTGNSIKAIRPLVKSQIGEAVYAAVYVNPLAKLKPDIWAVDLPWPHILEWNVFNSILSPSCAMDFDGILCHDCPAGSDDDGEKYVDFIRNAPPLYVPRRTAVPLIVTARIEKYRAETEAWLKRHGIRWNQLVMHPAKTLRERMRDNIPAYKARHYAAWAKHHRPSPGPVIFFESEDRQAREIARASQLMVICPHTAGVY
jgi:adenine/guanine phosphoribosyltransferase-like PRPP-binding protein